MRPATTNSLKASDGQTIRLAAATASIKKSQMNIWLCAF